MSIARRHHLARWTLLAILAVSLVFMHHTPVDQMSPGHGAVAVAATTTGPAPAVSPAPMPDEQGMGAMLHQCLAVFGQLLAGALLVLLLAIGFARLTGGHRLLRPRALARAPDRPDRPGGRSLLASVCVLRL
ncbi:hypothetical protein HFP15_39180 [Amycolatopsis sp. K13G38]|uniref:DUF2946 domain-containing protein n=1 Tax=Amycolatopsis acididurans TaxID=2724524 RepID=A0ABX1JJ77_9PSEU|nr:hypothetical protein [Amycolatopsis acididurans]NKQ58884.1 hypothetical protein [Amycolatopsis acididurans]